MKRWLNILIVVCILLTASSLNAEDRPALPESYNADEYDDENHDNTILYQSFREIKIIDKVFTVVYYIGDDAEKIGLDEVELGDYLRLKIKNNFANIKLEDRDYDKYTSRQVGWVFFRVWVTGENYPVAYHFKGSFCHSDNILRDSTIWEGKGVTH